MEIKAKKCKGTGKAIGYGCGKEVLYRTYGLCNISCYRKWLVNTKEGNKKIERSRIQAKKEIKRARDEDTRKRKAKLMTVQKFVLEVQKVFNTYIRLRDENKPCISCGTTNKIKYDAGHYYNANNHWFLRFHEDNVHKQCSNNCNKHLSGNLIKYRFGLIKRIGEDKLDYLDKNANNVAKYSLEELKELKEIYKEKIKKLKKD